MKELTEKEIKELYPDLVYGKYVYIGSGVQIEADVYIESGVRIESGVHIEDRVYIESGVRIESGVHIEDRVYIESGVRIESNVYIESGVRIGSRVRIESGVRIESSPLSILQGYKYIANAYIDANTNLGYIRLGCYIRTIAEWENDFDNNLSNFPIDSVERKQRWDTYQFCKNWLQSRIKGDEK